MKDLVLCLQTHCEYKYQQLFLLTEVLFQPSNLRKLKPRHVWSAFPKKVNYIFDSPFWVQMISLPNCSIFWNCTVVIAVGCLHWLWFGMAFCYKKVICAQFSFDAVWTENGSLSCLSDACHRQKYFHMNLGIAWTKNLSYGCWSGTNFYNSVSWKMHKYPACLDEWPYKHKSQHELKTSKWPTFFHCFA